MPSPQQLYLIRMYPYENSISCIGYCFLKWYFGGCSANSFLIANEMPQAFHSVVRPHVGRYVVLVRQ